MLIVIWYVMLTFLGMGLLRDELHNPHLIAPKVTKQQNLQEEHIAAQMVFVATAICQKKVYKFCKCIAN